jgi:hypothetical protein
MFSQRLSFNIFLEFEIQSRIRQSDAALVASLPEYHDGFMLPPFVYQIRVSKLVEKLK